MKPFNYIFFSIFLSLFILNFSLAQYEVVDTCTDSDQNPLFYKSRDHYTIVKDSLLSFSNSTIPEYSYLGPTEKLVSTNVLNNNVIYNADYSDIPLDYYYDLPRYNSFYFSPFIDFGFRHSNFGLGFSF